MLSDHPLIDAVTHAHSFHVLLAAWVPISQGTSGRRFKLIGRGLWRFDRGRETNDP